MNPLGAARGSYKVCQMFYTLADIPKNQRSNVDKLQLCMIFKEKLLKKYSPRVIFKRLLEDLVILEQGIMMNVPEPKLNKFGLLIYCADNLESHTIGGFSASFSSKSVCRMCHIQYNQLEDDIMHHAKWTCQEYDDIVKSINDSEANDEIVEHVEYAIDLETEDDLSEDGSDATDDDETEEEDENEEEIVSENWGLKYKCPFNDLKSFHAVSGFPPDLMHDWFEGVIPEDLLAIIRNLSSKRWFTLEAYNRKLTKFGWYSHEAGDKPQSVPLYRKAVKLKGKAISQWVHCRNFLMIIKEFIADNHDSVLSLALKLNEITERITASEFYEYEIEMLHDEVKDYLKMREDVRTEFPEFFMRPKPKHHFIRKMSKRKLIADKFTALLLADILYQQTISQ